MHHRTVSDSGSSEKEQHNSDSEPDSPDQDSEEDGSVPGPSAESCRPR